jgi:alkanesulfonate monooxygenase SsuD/methylene tetrahydromethanopterin reductase-like flavin-dependent oxidoreductase (luciferase family)
MRFGVTLGAAGEGRDPRGMATLAALAESSGWDGVFLEDYLVYQGRSELPTYDPWVSLAAMATATDRVRLGLTVTPVPRRKPWELAAQTVALDHLSGGRLILGVGAGDATEPGFAAVGEPLEPRVRAELLDEGLAILDALWTGEPVHHRGRHFRVDGLRLAARPVQRPRIPIWVGGDLLVAGVRRRLTRWDGACVYKGPPGAGEPLTPHDVRDIVELVGRARGSADGFDVKISHTEDDGLLAALTEAGATWCNRWLPPAPLDETRRAITRGPRARRPGRLPPVAAP